jgi:hypothetical protein
MKKAKVQKPVSKTRRKRLGDKQQERHLLTDQENKMAD